MEQVTRIWRVHFASAMHASERSRYINHDNRPGLIYDGSAPQGATRRAKKFAANLEQEQHVNPGSILCGLP